MNEGADAAQAPSAPSFCSRPRPQPAAALEDQAGAAAGSGRCYFTLNVFIADVLTA